MEKLYKMLDEVEERVDRFYGDAVALHNNGKLRSVAGTPIQILYPKYGSKLLYGPEGFYAIVPQCVDPGSYCEDARFEYPEYNFYEKDNKLLVKTHDGLQEMLHLFPKLTLGTLEEKLIEGVQKTGLFEVDRR